MNGAAPTTTEPAGHDNPFERQNVTESAGAARSAGATPSATAALKNRAPSTWSGTPRSWARRAISSVYATVSGWLPEWLWAFSIATRAVIGSWASPGSRNAPATSPGSSVPSGRSRSWRTLAPTTTAWPAASSRTMWL